MPLEQPRRKRALETVVGGDVLACCGLWSNGEARTVRMGWGGRKGAGILVEAGEDNGWVRWVRGCASGGGLTRT